MDDNCFDESQWDDFFRQYGEYESLIKAQKARGINNFNLLNTVLRVGDETRLHSRFIRTFLDPNGLHAQGDIFLKEFLRIISCDRNSDDIKKFVDGFDTNSAVVDREVMTKDGRFIDIYLTDGEKHIVIENKVYAQDGCNQIRDYVGYICGKIGGFEENDGEKISFHDILVIYLTINSSAPNGYSLGSHDQSKNERSAVELEKAYKVSSDCNFLVKYLYPDEKVSLYSNFHYSKNVVEWVDKCRRFVSKIVNLRYALDEYMDVVRRINGTYESRLMSLTNFLTGSSVTLPAKERLLMALKIEKELPATMACWLEEIMRAGGKADDIFNEYIKHGKLARVSKGEVSGYLKDIFYISGDAKKFFEKKRGGKNKAAMWKFLEGPNKNKLTLVIFYGVSAIHVGVFGVEVSDGLLGKSSRGVVDADFYKNNHLKVSLASRRNGLYSWCNDLKDELVAMLKDEVKPNPVEFPLDFENSDLAKLLEAVAT